jgi:Winged helix-turn helix
MPPPGEVRMVLRTILKPRTENDMTTDKKVARRKLSLLELASDLGNVSKACRVMGYSRQQFYEIRRNFQTYGADGLLDRLPGAKGPHPNRVAAEIETAILDYALAHPRHGPMRVAQELMLRGIQVSWVAHAGSGSAIVCLPSMIGCCDWKRPRQNASSPYPMNRSSCWSGSARNIASAISRRRTPAHWLPSITSSSAS